MENTSNENKDFKKKQSNSNSFLKSYIGFQQALAEEFDNKCGYCGTQLNLTDNAIIDSFYPRIMFPESATDFENLVLCCPTCNKNKSTHFPINENGEPLLYNPKKDNFFEHIKIAKDGTASPLTEKGRITIDTLKLNREPLVEDRKIRQIERDIIQSYKKGNAEYYQVFQENILKIRDLNKFSDLAKDEIKFHLLNMLYANAITSLETYLSDAFISTVKSDTKILRKFVETFHDYKQEKFELKDIFNYYEGIQEKAIKSMLDVIYHDLRKVKGMYEDTLNINFPEISTLYKAVQMRHDFVHRNGKNKDGKSHQITTEDIEKLCSDIEIFVKNINDQILQIKQ